jgi:ornithine--oxo-acid transaminase
LLLASSAAFAVAAAQLSGVAKRDDPMQAIALELPSSSLEKEQRFGARNYDPLPVVLSSGSGVWLVDTVGRRYLDMMSAYSAASHGHRHPRIVGAAQAQLDRMGVVSRAFHNDQLGPFLEELCGFAGMDRALPMNTGAEAVETAIKAARRYACETRGIPDGAQEIIVAEGNFHGRTTTIVGFSSEPDYRAGFGPFAPGFVSVPFGDAEAARRAIRPNTAAILIEPIQGEAGIRIPPDGYLGDLRRICDATGALLVLDEVQSGLGRTGRDFCFHHAGIKPDGLIVGKALGGGIVPVSAFLASEEVMKVFRPGSHGSTFGGNPLAAAIGRAALRVLVEEQLAARSARLGDYFLDQLRRIRHPAIREIRGRGLWIGVELEPSSADGRTISSALMRRGILARETQRAVVRFAPPLIIERGEIDMAVAGFADALEEVLPS